MFIRQTTCVLACGFAAAALLTGPIRPAETEHVAPTSPKVGSHLAASEMDARTCLEEDVLEGEAKPGDGEPGTWSAGEVACDSTARKRVRARFERLKIEYEELSDIESGHHGDESRIAQDIQDITDSFVDIGSFRETLPAGELPQGDHYRPPPVPLDEPQRFDGGLNQGIEYRDPEDYTQLVRDVSATRSENSDLSVRNENLNRQLAEEKLLREGEPGQRLRPSQDPLAAEPR